MQASQLKARVRGSYSGCKIRSKRKGNYVPFFDSMTDSQNAYQAAKTSNQYTSLYTAGIPAKFFADYDPQVHTCLKSPLETINREINFSSIVRSFGTERAHIKLLPTQMTEQSTTLTETISPLTCLPATYLCCGRLLGCKYS